MAPLPPNPALARLEALIGEWDVEVPQFPGASGHATVEWLEGGAFLRIHSVAPDPAPDSTQIIGRDDASGAYTVLYYDSRGVSRVYRMSFDDDVWKIWRDAPGFHQRFTATVGTDAISGAWEMSKDGSTWERDFDLHYKR